MKLTIIDPRTWVSAAFVRPRAILLWLAGAAILAVPLLLLTTLIPLQHPFVERRAVFGGTQKVALDRLSPGRFVGQAVANQKPPASLLVLLATYQQRPSGWLRAIILEGVAPPASLKEIKHRKVFEFQREAAALNDNDYWTIFVPLERQRKLKNGFYLILQAETGAQTPLTCWTDQSPDWPGPPADLLAVAGGDGALARTPLATHLSLALERHGPYLSLSEGGRLYGWPWFGLLGLGALTAAGLLILWANWLLSRKEYLQDIACCLALGLAALVIMGTMWTEPYHFRATAGLNGDTENELSLAYQGWDAWHRHGELPLWLPYLAGGMNWSGHPNNRLYSLWWLPLIWLGEVGWLKFIVTTLYLAGGLGLYWFCRKWLTLLPLPSLAAGLVYISAVWFARRYLDDNQCELSYFILPLYLVSLRVAGENLRHLWLPALILNLLVADAKLSVLSFPLIGLAFFLFLPPQTNRADKVRGITVIALSGLAGALLGAPKLLSYFDVAAQVGTVSIRQYFQIPFSWEALNTLVTHVHFPGERLKMWSLGLGWPAFILALGGVLLHGRRYWILMAAGLATYLLMLGDNSPLNLQALIHRVPLISAFTNIPKHYSIYLLFVAVVFAGLFFARFWAGLQKLPAPLPAAIMLATVLIASYLPWRESYAIMSGLEMYAGPPVEREEAFYHQGLAKRPIIDDKPKDATQAPRYAIPPTAPLPPPRNVGLYYATLCNVGSLSYKTMTGQKVMAVPRYIMEYDQRKYPNPDYWGECRWLDRPDLEPPRPEKLTYNTITVFVPRRDRAAILQINQNHLLGWSASLGEVVNQGGLIGVRLPPGEGRTLTLRYRPRFYTLALTLVVASAAGLAALFFAPGLTRRWSRTRDQATGPAGQG